MNLSTICFYSDSWLVFLAAVLLAAASEGLTSSAVAHLSLILILTPYLGG